VATNNSWGGGGFSQALQDAIERANTKGILFIAAAGNDGVDTETATSYPSGYPNLNIIAVASITSTGTLSSFSNYAATKVDLGAPGSAIYSCLPVSSKGKVVSGYGSYSGTSMATPHVTGAVALYASTHSGATATQIKTGILGSVVPTASLNGKCVTGGRLNVSGF
jgi:subtilisin family serine protease